MANPSVIALQLPSAVANGIAHAATAVINVPMTLNGSLVTAGVAILVPARRVSASSSGSDAGINLLIVGTDRYGNAQAEILALANSPTAAVTLRDFKTVTSVTSDATTSGNITVGTNAVGSSEWVLDDFTRSQWQLSVAISLAGGSGTASVDHTYSDPNKQGVSLTPYPFGFSIEPSSYVPPLVWNLTALTSKTSNTEAAYPSPIFAHRLTNTVGTGLWVMESLQAGIGDI